MTAAIKRPAALWPVLVYGLLAALILLPLLKPGFILTLDLVFTPQLPMPTQATNEYVLHTLLHMLSLVVPGDVIEKVLLAVILIGSGIGAHRLAAYLQSDQSKDKAAWPLVTGQYLAGALYMINPFTYSRFMAGQYLVLLGYMLLPFFVICLLRFLQKPDWRRCLWLAGMLTLLGAVSIHTLGLALFVGVVGALIYIWQHRQQKDQLIRLIKYGGLAAGAFVVASSYWLGPLLLNKGGTAQAIGQFSASDQQAFMTIGEGVGGKLFNVLHLQGFWAEGRMLYNPVDQYLPGADAAVVALWVLTILGGVALWREGGRTRAALVLLGVAATLAALVAALAISPWLTNHLPLLGGYREPHKFVALVALAFAVLAGQGGAAALGYWQKRRRPVPLGLVAGLLALVPLLLAPTMFWGFSGQLSARHYPSDWSTVNDVLNRDPANAKVLFLPWHLYMYYGFAARIIANPADKFFDNPIVSSNELEFGGASPTNPDPLKKRLQERILPGGANSRQLGSKLKPLGIKYVLLAKEYDYRTYGYLDRQTDLRLIYKGTALRLYQNEAFGRN